MPLRTVKYEKDRQTYAKSLKTLQDNLRLIMLTVNRINLYLATKI